MSKFVSKIVDQYPDLKYALLDAQTFDPKHYGFPAIYYKIMETDAVRVDAFRAAFKKYNNFKTVDKTTYDGDEKSGFTVGMPKQSVSYFHDLL